MKTFKSFAFGLLGMALVSSASAAVTTIRIAGSNGDRAATNAAIAHILNTGWTFNGINGGDTSAAFVAGTTSASTSTYGAFAGTWTHTVGGSSVTDSLIIKVSYPGALAGVAAVAGNLNAPFTLSNGADSGTYTVTDPTLGTNPGVDYEAAVPDFGTSTNFQSTSPFRSTYQGVTYANLIEEKVGCSPLVFYASAGFPGTPNSNAKFTATYNGPVSTGSTGTYVPNITTQLAQALYKGGSLRLSQFTGDTAHQNYTVFPLGRNRDAGQRFGVHTEIGIGVATNVKVWLPTYSTAQSSTTVSGVTYTYGGIVGSQDYWPVGTTNSVYYPSSIDGDGGYQTGPLLASNLTAVLDTNAYQAGFNDAGNSSAPAVGGFYIGYLTSSDGGKYVTGANIPVASQGVALKYNGVAYSTANIQNGSYTAWVYNRVIRRPGSPAARTSVQSTVRDFANTLTTQIINTDATQGGGIKLDASFKVDRSTDGGTVNTTFN